MISGGRLLAVCVWDLGFCKILSSMMEVLQIDYIVPTGYIVKGFQRLTSSNWNAEVLELMVLFGEELTNCKSDLLNLKFLNRT